ncbi:hypothetical protein [Niveispirillum sp. KHB5.9]
MSEKISKDDLAAVIAEATGSSTARSKEALERVLVAIGAGLKG